MITLSLTQSREALCASGSCAGFVFLLELYWKPSTVAYRLPKREGKLARISCFLFGLSEAADLLEGNRCSLLLPVAAQPVKEHRREAVSWPMSLGAKVLCV